MARTFGKSGRHYRYEPPSRRGKGALEFWAENGLVCMLDERFPEGDERHFDVLNVKDFLINLRAVNASIGRAAHQISRSVSALGGSAGGVEAEEREALHRLVADGIACAREAQRQGNPLDPRHAADMVKTRRKNMLYADVKAAGAISASFAPEAALLPSLPGSEPKKTIIIP